MHPLHGDLHYGIHEIGKEAAIENGRNDAEEFHNQIIKTAQIGKHDPKQRTGHKGKKCRQAPFEEFLVAVQLHSFSLSFSICL